MKIYSINNYRVEMSNLLSHSNIAMNPGEMNETKIEKMLDKIVRKTDPKNKRFIKDLQKELKKQLKDQKDFIKVTKHEIKT